MSEKIGILGPYSSRNLGDTATQIAAIACIRERRPDARFLGICNDPMDAARTHGVPAFSMYGEGAEIVPQTNPEEDPKVSSPNTRGSLHWRLRWLERFPNAARIASMVGKLDLLIISGGGQFDDFWGGPWGLPYDLLLWTSLARLRGVKVAVLGIGLDRLSTSLSRVFSFNAMRCAHFRSFRDQGTLDAVRAMGYRSPTRICPDLAFGLPVDFLTRAFASASAAEPFAVVSPISEKTWLRESNAEYDDYLRQLADTAVWLIGTGLRVRIVCSQTAMDIPAARRVHEAIPVAVRAFCEIRQTETVHEYFANVYGARVLFGSRLHALILALVANVPVVAISPIRKVKQVMHDFDLSSYCVEITGVKHTDLIARARCALDEEDRIRAQIRAKTQQFRASLNSTYDDMLRLIPKLHLVAPK